jgi:thiamine-phosphate pyrophosphorylase
MGDRTDLERLARAAANLVAPGAGRKALPGLLVFTDPDRSGDLEALAGRLPTGSALVYRAFGAPDAVQVGRTLRGLTRARGALLLVGADDALAQAVRADGVHLPQRLARRARRLRARHPDWLITTAAHSLATGRAALRHGADATVVSTVFPSASASAGAPMGAAGLARVVRRLAGPVYALGGVNLQTIGALRVCGAIGVAVVGAAMPQP